MMGRGRGETEGKVRLSTGTAAGMQLMCGVEMVGMTYGVDSGWAGRETMQRTATLIRSR